jgi:hypothetical protein
LTSPVTLQTDGESSLSGTLSDRGAYVLTGTRLLFFPRGEMTAASSQPLLVADGSAAQVTLAGGYAYVSEKNGSLEAFSLGQRRQYSGHATPVAGVPAGVIVGITGVGDVVVAPIAHLASNANQSTIPVASGLSVSQIVPTKEVAACWAASDGDEACVTNPGSMTVSCGHLGSEAFTSYTSAAASLPGETVFDIDMMDTLVGILGKSNGAPVLLAFSRTKRSGDFLSLMNQFPLGTATATGAVLLPASRSGLPRSNGGWVQSGRPGRMACPGLRQPPLARPTGHGSGAAGGRNPYPAVGGEYRIHGESPRQTLASLRSTAMLSGSTSSGERPGANC